MKILALLFLVLPYYGFAQYEGIYQLPLPERFATMKKNVIIYSSPNPNYAEFETTEKQGIVWKHRTIIKATEDLTIKETGAYLLRNGVWWKRAAFSPKETKEMFATKSLILERGDSLVFEKNWRYGKYTQTGWNFWYVIATTASGEEVYGYDILETKGRFEDNTQVLPLKKKNSKLTWTGKAGDSDYSLTGQITDFKGRLIVKDDVLKACSIRLVMDSMQHEIPSLIAHLKNKDFFHVKKYPEATFESEQIELQSPNTYLVKGSLCLRGICQKEQFNILLKSTEKAYEATFSATIDRTEYGMLYASSKDKKAKQSIADEIQFLGNFSFMKDYPGSMPWNKLKAP